jgi:DnaK suppressor protein
MALTPELLEHYRRILVARRDELAKGTVRSGSEAAEQADLEQLDPADRATANNAKDELFQDAERESGQLAEVEKALGRIQAGDYGTCEICGREIPEGRLRAIPWAALCHEDQELADRRQSTVLSQGGAPSRVA